MKARLNTKFKKPSNNLKTIDKITFLMLFSFYTLIIILSAIRKYAPNALSVTNQSFIIYIFLSAFCFVLSIFLLALKRLISKIFGIFLMLLFFISVFPLQVLIISFFNINSLTLLIFIFVFFTLILIASLKLVYDNLDSTLLNRFFAVLFGFATYMIILLDGSFIFFLYYAIRKYIPDEYIELFNHPSSVTDIFIAISSTTLGKFFNYSDSTLPTPISFRIPYFIGKLMDSILLAYIFLKLTSVDSRRLWLNKINSLNHDNKKLKELLIEEKSKSKRIVKKLRNDIESLKSENVHKELI
jgi:hypothetical protein